MHETSALTGVGGIGVVVGESVGVADNDELIMDNVGERTTAVGTLIVGKIGVGEGVGVMVGVSVGVGVSVAVGEGVGVGGGAQVK